MNLKTKYANAILNKKFGKLKRNISVFSFEKAKNIGIVWHTDDLEALNYLLSNLGHGNVSSLCFTEKKDGELSGSFNMKDTNWLGFPQSGHVKQFTHTAFDLLINVSLNESFPLKAIVALSKAQFKIGAAGNETNYYDLSIDVSKNPNSLFLAQQQLHYLKELKINN